MRYCLSIFYLLLATWLPAQQHDAATGCTDIVYLKGGSVYRGKILENPDNGPLVIQTWSGLTLHLPAAKIRRIVQHCPDAPKGGKSSFAPQPYTFRERGWYNATGMSVLAGRSWWNENVTGFSLYNSTGYLFSRWLGVGIGLGVDAYSPYVSQINQATYPVFAEARGYLMAKNMAPFYNLSAGWGFAGGKTNPRPGYVDDWRGGWLLQGRLGYRLGNHFTVFGGLRFQRQDRVWSNTWDQSVGKDRILHRRFEFGLGLLL